MFEQAYTRELIKLGYQDAMQVKDQLYDFVCGKDVPRLFAPAWVQKDLSGFESPNRLNIAKRELETIAD